MNFGDSLLDSRFWDKVIPEPNSGCWLWIACCNSKGYGSFWEPDLQIMLGAHRYAYEILVDIIPDGLDLDHKCRTTNCVNPLHLEPVTRSENVKRGDTGKLRGSRGHRNTVKTHCPKGHAYYPNNVYEYKDGKRCRICHLEHAKKQREKRLTLKAE